MPPSDITHQVKHSKNYNHFLPWFSNQYSLRFKIITTYLHPRWIVGGVSTVHSYGQWNTLALIRGYYPRWIALIAHRAVHTASETCNFLVYLLVTLTFCFVIAGKRVKQICKVYKVQPVCSHPHIFINIFHMSLNRTYRLIPC